MYRKIKLFLSVMLTLQILSQANPSFAFDEDNLWGVYLVKLDNPGPDYIARFTIYPDGSYHFEDYPTGTYLTHPHAPSSRCNGKYTFDSELNSFVGKIEVCYDAWVKEETIQTINFDGLTLKSLQKGTQTMIDCPMFKKGRHARRLGITRDLSKTSKSFRYMITKAEDF